MGTKGLDKVFIAYTSAADGRQKLPYTRVRSPASPPNEKGVIMFDSYLGQMFLAVLKVLALIVGGQLFIYWLIDKYTILNFPILYRIGVSILVTVGLVWYSNIR